MEHSHHDHHSSEKEIKVLLQYMINHNEAHNKEILELAKSIKEQGHEEEYNQILQAVESFKDGNSKLALALGSLTKGE